MHLKSVHIQNYRRLKDVHIDLGKDVSIFVGANNSGKTSATNLIVQFLNRSSRSEPFTLYDFHASSWSEFNEIGRIKLSGQSVDTVKFPCITMDLWLSVEDKHVHRVIDFLPSLDWKSAKAVIGVRLQLEPKEPKDLLNRFADAYNTARNQIPRPQGNEENGDSGSTKYEFHPWPIDFCDFLRKKLSAFYSTHYYVLDLEKFGADGHPQDAYIPEKLGEGTGKKCQDIIGSLIRIDAMNAQRHLTDQNTSPSSRSESLSKRFSRFYGNRNQKHENDYQTMQALNDSEKRMNDLFEKVFNPTLNALQKMGYPGFANPHLQIRSSINPEKLLQEGADVHYSLNGTEGSQSGVDNLTLPDRYNGLGFKNLIYMVIELMDYHEQWLNDEVPPLLHLIIIEEPEVHLHVQLQQVFIRQISKLLEESLPDEKNFTSQLIVTTHSPHVIYEKGFSPIRYFRREEESLGNPVTKILNLNEFSSSKTDNDNNLFLKQYMRLTHCDLFFADAAVLVEGSVEKLLLPLMIEKTASGLLTKYLSVLDVGGAFAYRFLELIDFLGITTLIITDLDSVCENIIEDKNGKKRTPYKACPATEPAAITTNQTLKEWFPGKNSIDDILRASNPEKIRDKSKDCGAMIRVAYQYRRTVKWKDESRDLVGRTFEEMFALENLEWCQSPFRKSLKLTINTKSNQHSLEKIAEKLFERVRSDSFKKTEFALRLITEDTGAWKVPHYIAEGLKWLEDELAPSRGEGLAESTNRVNIP